MKMEEWMGNILRGGVIASALVVVCGAVMYLSRYGAMDIRYAHFLGEPERLKNISDILRSAFSFRPRGIIQLGLLFLIATPIMRVLFSIGIYARQKDALYVVITSIVLGLLLYSLLFVR
jgi:uncharacterized membrane protein